MSSDPERRNVKTTVYLDSDDYRKLKGLAQAEGRSAAELVREAVAEYARRRTSRLRPRSIGAGRSGRGDVADCAEELLNGFGQDE
ncbi:MAG: ribbon-helix-helix domain-containing protein [Rhodothermales bacterium]